MSRDWEADLELIPEGDLSPEPEPVQEHSLNTQQVQELAKASLDFLAAMCMPTIFKYLFPPVFQAIWRWLLSYVNRPRDFSQLAIGLPRGFGKTMLIKIFIIFCILFTKKSFILIICGTQTKANNLIADIMMMLTEPNILKVFGSWKISASSDEFSNRQDLKRFGFRGRNIILAGAGTGSDVRGITLNNERPDIMIFDDIQTRAEAESEVVSGNIETWMVGTAMKAKSPEGCLFIFIANMYPTKYSLLRKLKSNPMWVKFIVGGILADGTSLWEDLQPLRQLLNEYQNDCATGRPEIFFAEVLNDENATVNHLLDLSKLPTYPYSSSDIALGKFIVIDPATDKKDSDAVTVAYFEVYDIQPVLKEIEEGRFSPGETIAIALRMALTHNCALIAVESQAYQYSLLYWFTYICQQYGISGIQAEPVYSGTTSKPQRILSMFKSLMAKEIYISPDCSAQFNAQASAYMPARRDNTDGLLDCVTYGPKVLELYSGLVFSANILEDQNSANSHVYNVLETACF